jgi:TolA-binding protein
VDSFQEVLEKYPTSRFAPYAAYYLGLHYIGKRERERGIELLQRILGDCKDFPLTTDVLYQLAMAFWDTGEKEEVKRYLKELISRDPSHLRARMGERVLSEL